MVESIHVSFDDYKVNIIGNEKNHEILRFKNEDSNSDEPASCDSLTNSDEPHNFDSTGNSAHGSRMDATVGGGGWGGGWGWGATE